MIATGWAAVEAAVVADYRTGMNVGQVAAKYGLSYVQAAGIVRRHGATRNKGGKRKSLKYRRFTDEERAAIIPCETTKDVVPAYFSAFPDSARSPEAVLSYWYKNREAA